MDTVRLGWGILNYKLVQESMDMHAERIAISFQYWVRENISSIPVTTPVERLYKMFIDDICNKGLIK